MKFLLILIIVLFLVTFGITYVFRSFFKVLIGIAKMFFPKQNKKKAGPEFKDVIYQKDEVIVLKGEALNKNTDKG